MAVAATRWRQDNHLVPTNLNQRLRWYPTFPSDGGGFSTFGWSPVPLDNARLVGSPDGIIDGSGLSGLGAPLIPSLPTFARGLGAVLGIVAGVWLAKKNLGD